MNKPEDPITINEQEYQFDKLPSLAQETVITIQGIDKSLDNLAGQMAMLQMARLGYIDVLNAVLDTEEKQNATQENPQERGLQENAQAQ